jgi:LuxR family maltose regulon positive regulatory protein
VVLDDYHLIDSERVHSIVSFMLERLPEAAHLVVSVRVDPPLPLTRLRARGQMAELHAPDLRFTPEEAPRSWATLWAGTCPPKTPRRLRG